MKMKKLLSIGALGLVLACSTSIGASAAARPSNDKIKTDMVKLFLNNGSPLTYGVTASTKVENVFDIDQEKLDKLETHLSNYGYAQTNYATLTSALGLIEPDQSVSYNAKKIVEGVSLNDLLSEVRSLTVVLRGLENSDATKTSTIEQDIIDLVNNSNSTLDVIFGKNIDGKITMSVMQENQIILQLNSENAYTINNSLGNDADKLTQYADALKLFIQ